MHARCASSKSPLGRAARWRPNGHGSTCDPDPNCAALRQRSEEDRTWRRHHQSGARDPKRTLHRYFRRPTRTLVVPPSYSKPASSLYWFEGDSCRRLSGFGKGGIGVCSETCEQFHEFGAQSVAARRGERVKWKETAACWHSWSACDPPSECPASAYNFSVGARHNHSGSCSRIKKARGLPTQRWFRYRGKKRSLRVVHSDYPIALKLYRGQ